MKVIYLKFYKVLTELCLYMLIFENGVYLKSSLLVPSRQGGEKFRRLIWKNVACVMDPKLKFLEHLANQPTLQVRDRFFSFCLLPSFKVCKTDKNKHSQNMDRARFYFLLVQCNFNNFSTVFSGPY